MMDWAIPFMVLSIQSVIDAIGSAVTSVFGSELLLGIFVFLVIVVLTLVFGLGLLVGIVVLIPGMFLVFEFIPAGRIIFAIILGFIVGLGLYKLIRG